MRFVVAIAAAGLAWAGLASAAPPSPAYDALNQQADVALQAGRWAEALARSDQAIPLETNYAQAYLNRGKALLGLGRFKEAEAALQSALSRDVDLHLAWYLLGDARLADGRPDEAIEPLLRGSRLHPNDGYILGTLAEAYLKTQRYAQAQESFEQALKLRPNDRILAGGLGRTLLAQRKFKEAAVQLDAAIAAGDTFAVTHFDGAIAHHNLGEYAQAIAGYRKVIELEPRLVQAHVALILVLAQSGDKAAARAAVPALAGLDAKAAADAVQGAGL